MKNRGLVLLFDPLTDTYKVVPPDSASMAFSGKPKSGTATFAPLEPIRKRTPQERVDSLMLRWIDDCKRAGTVPGLGDMAINQIVSEAWKSGRTEITAEVVREVAAHFLQQAENEHEAKLAKQITSHED